MPKVLGKSQSSLWQRNPAPYRRVKTSQEHQKVLFQAARNKNTSRILNSKFSQSPSNNTSQMRVGLVLCYPSAFIHLCTIFSLVFFNSAALLHICHAGLAPGQGLPQSSECRGGTHCRPPIKESCQGQSLPVPFPSMPAVAHASYLPCLLNLATTKTIVGVCL